MSLVFTRMPGELYRSWLLSFLCLCDDFWVLINYLFVKNKTDESINIHENMLYCLTRNIDKYAQLL